MPQITAENKADIQDVLRSLIYFDLFNHPLKMEEIQRFMQQSCSKERLQELLNAGMQTNALSSHNRYFGFGNVAANVKHRHEKETKAADIEGLAKKNAKIIAAMPFTECVCISGSLSKGVMEEGGDIDYFIIAKPNRIWIAKMFLKAYKWAFLGNKKDFFCINYIISSDNLEIKEKNLFTATEIETLLVMNNEALFTQFLKANQWYGEVLPNKTGIDQKKLYSDNPIKKYGWARWIEKRLNNNLGDRLDEHFRLMAEQRNAKKYKKDIDSKAYDLMYRSHVGEAKVHPPNSQGKILDLYNEACKTLGLDEER